MSVKKDDKKVKLNDRKVMAKALAEYFFPRNGESVKAWENSTSESMDVTPSSLHGSLDNPTQEKEVIKKLLKMIEDKINEEAKKEATAIAKGMIKNEFDKHEEDLRKKIKRELDGGLKQDLHDSEARNRKFRSCMKHLQSKIYDLENENERIPHLERYMEHVTNLNKSLMNEIQFLKSGGTIGYTTPVLDGFLAGLGGEPSDPFGA